MPPKFAGTLPEVFVSTPAMAGAISRGVKEGSLRRLGPRLGAFPFAARWGRLVVLDADTVLALSQPQPRSSALYSLAGAPVRRRDPATDAWVATA